MFNLVAGRGAPRCEDLMAEVQESVRQLEIWEAGYVVAGRYEVIRCLGIGSMGIVYLCRHLALDGFLVALKVLAPSHHAEGEEQFFTRFKTEILATRSIAHPNVVCTYDYVSEPGLEAYSMEYMRGGDLANYLRRVTHLPLRAVVQMLAQMCAGVQAIHDADFMHRDLKPENFLLSESHQIKIADFGIARAAFAPRITARGGVVGTLQYLSPQYLQTGEYTRQSDIYSLGVLGYEMITGALPFGGSNLYQMIELKLTTDPPSPQTLNPSCPTRLGEIVLRALSRDVGNRYEAAREMERDLRSLLEQTDAIHGEAGPRRALAGLDAYERHLEAQSMMLARPRAGTSTATRALSRRRSVSRQHRLGIIVVCGILLGMLPVLYLAGRAQHDFKLEMVRASENRGQTVDAAIPAATKPSGDAVQPLVEERRESGLVPETSKLERKHETQPVAPRSPMVNIESRNIAERAVTEQHEPIVIQTKQTPAPVKPAKRKEEPVTGGKSAIKVENKPAKVEPPVSPAAEAPVEKSEVSEQAQPDVPSAEDPSAEYKVRATLLYRFADYVDWPESAFPSPSDPLRLCIVGSNPFGSFLTQSVAKVRTKQGRAIEIKFAADPDSAACNVLYLSDAKRSSVEAAGRALSGKGVLLVSEDTGRGMVNFVVRDRKVKFEIDAAEIARSGLKINQLLLDLASRVRGA